MTNEQMQWIENLYLEMYDLLCHYSNAVLQDALQSEEAVQETFRIACDKPEAILESTNPRGWVMNTLKGVLQNLLRKNRKQSDLFVQMTVPEEALIGENDPVSVELLYGNVAQTKEFQLIRAVSDGETVKDLSRRLGISEDSCKKRVQRSRHFLRKKITP